MLGDLHEPKVYFKRFEPDCRILHNSRNFQPICKIPFACFREEVKVYFKAFFIIKYEEEHKKNEDEDLATPRRLHIW